jgi:outer membrane lipoprotein-sorting protein
MVAKNFVVTLLWAALFFLVSGGAFAGESHETAIRVESIQADFVQEKQLAILARPLISQGHFSFQAPGSLRWEYFSPMHSVLLLHDGKARKFIKKDGEFVEEHSMGLDAMQVVLQEISSWLDGEITDTATFKAELDGTGRILLTPRQPALARIISRIELQLRGKTGLMESVIIYEGPGSQTTMRFSKEELNQPIADSRFREP